MIFAALVVLWREQQARSGTVRLGVIVDARPAELHGVVGPFTNIVVLVARLAHEQRFRDVLATVRALWLEAYADKDVPIEAMAEALSHRGTGDAAALFSLLLVWRDPPPVPLRLPGLVATPPTAVPDEETLVFPLGIPLLLDMQSGPDALAGRILYRQSLVSRARALELRAALLRLAAAVADDPDVSPLSPSPPPARG
jgi:hypothetical protein